MAGFLVLALGFSLWPFHRDHPAQLNERQRAEDFDEVWNYVNEHDCYLPQEPVDWNAAKAYYRPQALAATNMRQFVAVIEQLLDELHDGHTHLDRNWPDSWCLPAADFWAEWRGESAIVMEVRRGGRAAHAGLRPGDEILALNGAPLRPQAMIRLGHRQTGSNPGIEQWALIALLAGRHNETRNLMLRSSDGTMRECSIPPEASGPQSPPPPPFEWRLLPGNIGYMHFDLFVGEDIVDEFDAALDALRGTRGLILDVRDNGGGNTDIAEPIMGRFISHRTQYAWMTKRDGAGLSERWREMVRSRGPWTYTQPIVVIVNHWSASMAEGFAMGLNGMKRATIVGTRMAGMGSGVEHPEMPNCGIVFQVSTAPVYQVSGAPRSDFRPDVQVRLDSPEALVAADPILDAGIAELEKKLPRTHESANQ